MGGNYLAHCRELLIQYSSICNCLLGHNIYIRIYFFQFDFKHLFLHGVTTLNCDDSVVMGVAYNNRYR